MEAKFSKSTCLQRWMLILQFSYCVSLIFGCLGCQNPTSCVDGSCLQSELAARLDHTTPLGSSPGQIQLPPDVNLEDGLSEHEAVAIALWNNRDFLATLANLGIARGDLVQAGLLTNPQLNVLFPPLGSKQLEWTLFTPIEAFLLRKQRIEIAEQDFQRICNELVQNGLNVARDARQAYADYQFAIDRSLLAQEAVEVRVDIANLAQKRLAAGDISELEALVAQIDANRSKSEAAGLTRGVQLAEANLKNTLGLATLRNELVPIDAGLPPLPQFDEAALIEEALAIRPDMKAAHVARQVAERRVELARRSFLRIDAVADGNSGGAGPTNTGPGIRLEVPIFNRNQGLIIRSQWTVDQARHNYQSVHDRVITEVRTSITSAQQASENLRLLRGLVLPDLEDAIVLSQRSYQDGGDDYFLVLQATSQLIDSRIRELELVASVRRSLAELDRSVGRRLSFVSSNSPDLGEENRLLNAESSNPPIIGEPTHAAALNESSMSFTITPTILDSSRRLQNTSSEAASKLTEAIPLAPRRFTLSSMHAK